MINKHFILFTDARCFVLSDSQFQVLKQATDEWRELSQEEIEQSGSIEVVTVLPVEKALNYDT